jgi:hypothetical protein
LTRGLRTRGPANSPPLAFCGFMCAPVLTMWACVGTVGHLRWHCGACVGTVWYRRPAACWATGARCATLFHRLCARFALFSTHTAQRHAPAKHSSGLASLSITAYFHTVLSTKPNVGFRGWRWLPRVVIPLIPRVVIPLCRTLTGAWATFERSRKQWVPHNNGTPVIFQAHCNML